MGYAERNHADSSRPARQWPTIVIVLAWVFGVLLLGAIILTIDAYREDSEAVSDEWHVTRVDGQLRWERDDVTYIDTNADDKPDWRTQERPTRPRQHKVDRNHDGYFDVEIEEQYVPKEREIRQRIPDLPVPARLRREEGGEAKGPLQPGTAAARRAPEPEPEEIRPLLPATAPAPLEPETGEQVYNWKNADASFIHGHEWSVSTLSDRRIALRAAGDDEGRIELEYGPFSRWYFRARGRDSVSVAKRLTAEPPRGARDDFEPGVASQSTVGGATSYRLDDEVRYDPTLERRQRVTTVYIPVDSRHLFVATYTRDADAEDTATQAAFERLLETLQFGNRWRPER